MAGNGRNWRKPIVATVLAVALFPAGPGQLAWANGQASAGEMLAQGTAGLSRPVAIQATAVQTSPVVKLIEEVPVTAGVMHRLYTWRSTRSGKEVSANADVLVVDLHNPYVELDLMIGQGGKVTTRQSVNGMARETGAVAAINGDVYNINGQGVSIGGQVKEGQLVSSPTELPGMYAFALTNDRKPVIGLFAFEGLVTKDGFLQYPISGLNKEAYWHNGRHSHADAIHMYNSDWGSKNRGNDGATTPTEVLVQNERVVQIVPGGVLDMVPPADGYILRASGKAAKFLTDHFQPGDPIYAEYRLTRADAAGAGESSYKMLLGGHTILVDGGQAAAFSRDIAGVSGSSPRARTAIGHSQDGRYVYLITVDNSGDSKGMTLKELQSFMVSIGVWKGINLDGGGSTQMVARPLGETLTVVVNDMEQNTARRVVNGIGVYTTAPQGSVLGLFVESEPVYFIGERAELALRAYDEYYNPIVVNPASVHWTSHSPEVAEFEGSFLTGRQPGTVNVTAVSGNGIQASGEIRFAGRGEIAQLFIEAGDFLVAAGNTYTLRVMAETKQGVKREVPAELVDWTFIGFEGTVSGNEVTVTSVGDGDTARFVARYDGYGAMLTKPVGTDVLFADFDGVTPLITPQSTHGDVPANLLLQREGNSRTNTLVFDYNFTGGSGTKAIYAAFGQDGAGVPIPGKPSLLRMNVFGDASLNWLRAEIVDGNGETRLVDLATPVNWSGWKAVTVDLEAAGLAYPLTLRRIYVVNPESGQEERLAIGRIAVDDIEFQQKRILPEMHRAKVEMALGRKSITVDGEERELDFAPYAVQGHTLIPIRFFVDALGGDVYWDQKTKRASVIRDGHLVEMWVQDGLVTVDGRPAESPVPPEIRGGRVMLPLRFIASVLGWDVGWNGETRSITLK